MAITQEFMHHMTELPADDGVAGQRQIHSMGPESNSSTFRMCSQQDICSNVKEWPC